MATAEASNSSHVRHSRRRPFSTWMKRLTNLKSSSSSDSQSGSRVSGKRNNNNNNNNNNMLKSSNKRQNGCAKNNPYPLSGTIRDVGSPQSYNDTVSYTESTDAGQPQHEHHQSASQQSLQASTSEQNIPGNSAKSTAPTLSTNGDTARSEAGYSKTGTTVTGHGGVYGGGEGSTFSSPAPSVRSLTTTLTTVQSAAPSAHIYGIAQNNQNTNGPVAQNSLHQQNQFAHQFPPSPASAVPPHLAMTGHPTTYSSATANNILTDNASILTLASSSKRRRRNSLDTNASVRALAPSSVFGGSRESLPLSVLSANVGADASNASITNASGVLSRQSLVGLASAERISVYSASGTVPSLVHGGGGDRSSLIANKQGDNGSVRSGTHSHTRNDSAAGSVAGTIGSTLNNTTSAAMTSAATPGRISRRSSGWGEISGEGEEGGTHQQQQREIDQSSSEKTEEPNQENNSDPGPSIDEEPKQ